MKLLKRILCAALAVFIITSAVTAVAAPVTATPTKSSILINNKSVQIQGYNIAGNNYFKLRDVAMAMNTSGSAFAVQWDENSNAIWLKRGQPYLPIGGELSFTEVKDAQAEPATAKVYVNGKEAPLTAYNIAGYNYFKLRDLGMWIDFGVTYDAEKDTIHIDGTHPYYVANILSVIPDAYYDGSSGKTTYNAADVGNITITGISMTSYEITGKNLTAEKGLPMFRGVIGTFVSQPDQVMVALEKSRNQGKQTVEIDGINVACMYFGQEMTVEISW